jgi:hypothetical protein
VSFPFLPERAQTQLDTIYFDWSQHRGICALRNDDDLENASYYLNLDELLDSLNAPSRIIGEATFESFRLDKRKAFMERCGRDGHELLTVPNRQTGRWRRYCGFESGPNKAQSKRTDAEDVHVIREQAREGMHLKRPSSRPSDEFTAKRERIAATMVRLRAEGELSRGPRGGVKWVPLKAQVAALLRDELPDYAAQPETRRIALGDGSSYSTTLLIAVWVAAREAANRTEFERLAGMYAHGYGCQVRSDLMYWGWVGGTQRKVDKETGYRADLSLSDYRREIRWLYHHLKDVELDETGTINP